MNLRFQSGFAHSRLTLDAFFQSQSGFPPPDKPTMNCPVKPLPASCCQTGTAFPIPCQVIN
jgi:hypothetical protein